MTHKNNAKHAADFRARQKARWLLWEETLMEIAETSTDKRSVSAAQRALGWSDR